MTNPIERLRQLLTELRRRNVYRVAATYLAVAFVGFQAVKLLIPTTTLPGWGDELILALLIAGFPVALVVAWAFEVTPDGVRRSEGAPPGKDAVESGEGLGAGYRILVGLGLVAAAVAGGWYLTGGGGPTISDRSVAVLPFQTLGDSSAVGLTEGLHSNLITRLQRVGELTVIARPSVTRYRDSDKPLSQVADELNARWIVTADVQTSGDQVQVNPRLVDPRTGTERWSNRYRRELSSQEVFAVQGEITREVAEALQAQLASDERERVGRQPTGDLGAYRLYAQGRRELQRRSQADVERAVRLFREAIERDSSFAEAWAGLADAAGHEWWGYEGYDTLGVSPEQAARRALRLAPDLAETHASMGLVHYRHRNGPAALRELQRAVELKPSYAEAHNWLGLLHLVLGRPEQALQHLELARDLNPRHLLARHYLYDTYVMMGQPERALSEIQEQERRYPEYIGPHVAKARALYLLGRFEEAKVVLRERLLGEHPVYEAYMAVVEAALGDSASARERVGEITGREVPPYVPVFAHAAVGDTEKTIESFQAIEDWRYIPNVVLRYEKFPEAMSRMRDDPRYDSLIREVNRYWGLNADGSLPDSVEVSFGAAG